MIKTISLVLDLLKVYVCIVGIEYLQKITIDFRLDRLKLVQIIFSTKFSNSAQARLTCRVLCFALRIKGKTLATFYGCC